MNHKFIQGFEYYSLMSDKKLKRLFFIFYLIVIQLFNFLNLSFLKTRRQKNDSCSISALSIIQSFSGFSKNFINWI